MRDRVIALEDPAVGSANRVKIQPNKLMDPPTNMIVLDCAGGETIVPIQEKEIAAVARRAVSYSLHSVNNWIPKLSTDRHLSTMNQIDAL
jgi:hypothetical protein